MSAVIEGYLFYLVLLFASSIDLFLTQYSFLEIKTHWRKRAKFEDYEANPIIRGALRHLAPKHGFKKSFQIIYFLGIVPFASFVLISFIHRPDWFIAGMVIGMYYIVLLSHYHTMVQIKRKKLKKQKKLEK